MRLRSMLALGALLMSAAASSAEPQSPASVFITLGTMGGPIADPKRSQPANVLLRGTDAWLVDAGDGTVQRLAAAGVRLNSVRAVFLSHLHFDHTGGLAAILGLRYQTDAPGVLIVYGPPGTKRLVDGLLASMQPAAEAGYGLPGAKGTRPEDLVRTVELQGGARVELPGIVVTAAENSHYSFPEGSDAAARYKSLSFRFDMPERSIVYTGDTGPSADVERLAKGADLYVSEVIDLDATLANVRRNSPDMPAPAFDAVRRHLAAHHVSPAQVGEMANRAGVKKVVLTHIVPGTITPQVDAAFRAAIARTFSGPVEIADDLDRY